MSRILIVEDEAHIAQGIAFNLTAEDHSVHILGRGEDALDLLLAKHEDFDALVLDVMLPGKDGFAVARELRAAKNYIPILILTARGRPEDVLQGFEAGADDYLPKPFNLAILIARIESLLRRKTWLHGSGERQIPAEPPDIFRFGDREVDFEKLQLRAGANIVQLTVMECDLLRYLIRHAGHPVSRKAILEDVWNLHGETDTRAIDNFVVRLRRYIEPQPEKPRYLLTIRGIGYQFAPKPG